MEISSVIELGALTEEERALALERYGFLKPHFESRKSLASPAKAAGIPCRTAQRGLMLCQNSGLAGRRHGPDRRGGAEHPRHRQVMKPELREGAKQRRRITPDNSAPHSLEGPCTRTS